MPALENEVGSRSNYAVAEVSSILPFSSNRKKRKKMELKKPNSFPRTTFIRKNHLHRKPVTLSCPNCLAAVKRTVKETYVTKHTHALAAILTPVLMTWVPYTFKFSKSVTHYCPYCRIQLGVTEFKLFPAPQKDEPKEKELQNKEPEKMLELKNLKDDPKENSPELQAPPSKQTIGAHTPVDLHFPQRNNREDEPHSVLRYNQIPNAVPIAVPPILVERKPSTVNTSSVQLALKSPTAKHQGTKPKVKADIDVMVKDLYKNSSKLQSELITLCSTTDTEIRSHHAGSYKLRTNRIHAAICRNENGEMNDSIAESEPESNKKPPKMDKPAKERKSRKKDHPTCNKCNKPKDNRS